jgi:hypothetical protein
VPSRLDTRVQNGRVRNVNKAADAAKLKSLPQPPLSGNGRYYPRVGGWDIEVHRKTVEINTKAVWLGLAAPNPPLLTYRATSLPA